MEWRATTARQSTVPLEKLSRAQCRWAETAVAVATQLLTTQYSDEYPVIETIHREGSLDVVDHMLVEPAPLVVTLDEPEAALHRSAEAHMAQGLAKWARHLPARVVVASHSPEVLDLPDAQLLHVARRDKPHTEVMPLTAPSRGTLSAFGLTPSDLLRRQRAFLLVEGRHEEIVLDGLIGDALHEARVDVLPLRGGRELPATIDSQFLFHYTDAHIIAMLDAVSAKHIQGVWHEALTLVERPDADAASEYLRKQIPGKQPERKWLREFLTLGLSKRQEQRLTPFGLTAGDIVEYLPVELIVGGNESWPDLRMRHSREGGSTPFKPWLTKRYGADFSAERIRAAVKAMDTIPEEFTALISLCQSL